MNVIHKDILTINKGIMRQVWEIENSVSLDLR